MAKRGKKSEREIESYAHPDKDRVNNPQVGLVTSATDPDVGSKSYNHDPHLDPYLSWASKSEHTSFEVPTVSLHVHERIDPRTIVEAVRKPRESEQQRSLFDTDDENPPIRQAIEFYKHRKNWTNRLIAGDSLLVMNSLLEKEGLGSQIQTIYMDPPYGIRYGSNFQPFVNRREVTDGKDEDLTTEPEQIRAFRDTWELGIHSYLAYLRDRLLLARELLNERGSCFVQIGDENVHRVGLLMDEIFGAENRLATISFATASTTATTTLPEVSHFLLWYAKDRRRVKYRQLYERLTRTELVEFFAWGAMVELSDGVRRKLTAEERFDPDTYLPRDARLCTLWPCDSQGTSKTGRSEPYVYEGHTFRCATGRSWSISREGIDRLAELGRLAATENQSSLRWTKYEDEIPGRQINNMWASRMNSPKRIYIVQTALKVIQRVILMSSDPGDIVFDPTCGSGTAAYVAEQWGRRWITCDTSRVAISIAKQRLMTANFDYYELNHPEEGVGAGLRCNSVANVTMGSLGYDEPAQEKVLYDQPLIDKTKARVTGPFTVEAVPAPVVQPIDKVVDADPLDADNSVARTGETVRQEDWREELLKTGIRGKAGQHLAFVRVEPLPGTRWLHADGESRITPPPPPPENNDGTLEDTNDDSSRRVVISFGPDHAPMEQRQVERAIEEAWTLVPKPKIIVFAAFQFDPEAAKDIDETNWAGTTLLKVQMNADLLTADLKKKRATNESFWLIGQPDVTVERLSDGANAGKYQIAVHGFDYFNTNTDALESGGAERIAVWLLDPDYDGRSLFPRQVFFPMASAKEGWAKLARNLKAEIDTSLIEKYRGTTSLPFESGEHGRAAVKIVDDRGIESLKIVALV